MKRLAIAVSAAAGLAVAFPLYQLFLLPGMCESPTLTRAEAVATLASFASYLCVPFLPGRLRGQRTARFVWLWTPAVGSTLTALALYCLVSLKDWGLAHFAAVWLALCLWTLPFAAGVYYSGTMVRGVRRRLGGAQEGLR